MTKTGTEKTREPRNCRRHESASLERADEESGPADKGDSPSSITVASKPSDWTASASFAGETRDGSKETRARRPISDTAAEVTPGWAARHRSTPVRHESHVIPPTPSVTDPPLSSAFLVCLERAGEVPRADRGSSSAALESLPAFGGIGLPGSGEALISTATASREAGASAASAPPRPSGAPPLAPPASSAAPDASAALKPASTTASTSAASSALPVTTAQLPFRSTTTPSTPATADRTCSTLPVQWLHIMPSTDSVVVAGAAAAGGARAAGEGRAVVGVAERELQPESTALLSVTSESEDVGAPPHSRSRSCSAGMMVFGARARPLGPPAQ
mmetsp:Transcript_25949/g.77705  ORF Transcript_25949/g.77705 Transcript_25949/m.77705 type:complete len:332 (+) Transcript_25949:2285-3280(+)